MLKPYMGWMGDDPADGACLVFAYTAREARRLAFDVLRGWFDDAQWIHARTRRLRLHAEWLRTQADQAALAEGRSHVIDDPASCKNCDRWGPPINDTGSCERCAAEIAEFGELDRG